MRTVRQQRALNRRRPAVYVAGPMSSSGNFATNIREGKHVGRDLIDLGFSPFIPHLDAHLPRRKSLTWEVFLECDLAWVRRSDALLRLPGESEGADLEIRVARANGVPVFHSVADLVAWAEDRHAAAAR